jgi:hypothetical protein
MRLWCDAYGITDGDGLIDEVKTGSPTQSGAGGGMGPRIRPRGGKPSWIGSNETSSCSESDGVSSDGGSA